MIDANARTGPQDNEHIFDLDDCENTNTLSCEIFFIHIDFACHPRCLSTKEPIPHGSILQMAQNTALTMFSCHPHGFPGARNLVAWMLLILDILGITELWPLKFSGMAPLGYPKDMAT
jgi:hypothetical protein